MVGWFRNPKVASPEKPDLTGWPSDWDDPVPPNATTSTSTTAHDSWGGTYPTPAPACTSTPPVHTRRPGYSPSPPIAPHGHRYERYELYESSERYQSAPARRRERSREGSWQSTPSTPAATGTNNVPLGRRSRYPSGVSHPAATSYVSNAFDRPSDRVDTTNTNTWSSPDDRRAAPASEAHYVRPQRSDHQSEIPSRCPWGEPTPDPKHSSTSTQRRDRIPESQARYARDARDSSVQAPRFGNDQRGYHDGSAADSPTARSEHRRRENSRPGGSHSSASRKDTSSHIRRPESITGTNMIPLAYSRYRATSGVNDTAAPKPSSASRDKSRPDPDTSSHHASAAPLRATKPSPVKAQDKHASAPQDLVAIEASLQAVLTRRKVRLGSPSTRKLFGSALRSVAYQYNATASPYTAYSRNLKGQQTQDAQNAQVSTAGSGAIGVEASATTMVSTPSAADDDWWDGPQGPPAVSADAISDSCGAADASSSKKRSREEQQNSQQDDAERNKKSKIDGVSENEGVSEVEGVSELDVPSESTVAVDPWSNWASPESQDQKTPLSTSPSSKDTAATSQATTVRVESESENVDPATNMTPPMSPRVVAYKSGHLLSCPVPRAPPSVEHEAVQQLEIDAKQLGSGWF